MGVKVTFLREGNDKGAAIAAQPTILVPKAAVTTQGDQSYVFVVSGDTVEHRPVRVGGADGDRLEVIGGLRSGERVIVTPPPALAAGKKIVIQ
jgi:multidrug efflux pump subunit AcrA (membrane-fusion protein)